jgi:hypothetical protein
VALALLDIVVVFTSQHYRQEAGSKGARHSAAPCPPVLKQTAHRAVDNALSALECIYEDDLWAPLMLSQKEKLFLPSFFEILAIRSRSPGFDEIKDQILERVQRHSASTTIAR